MKNKMFSAALALLFSVSAYASEKAHSNKVVSSFLASAPGIGSLRVEVKDIGEPVYRPLLLTVSVTCKNKTAAGKKAVVEVLKQDTVCDYRDAQYDERSKTLTIHYSTSEFSLDQAQCNGHWSQSFDLRELCTPTTP